LLVFITEKIVAVCRQIVALYNAENGTTFTQAAPGLLLLLLRGCDRLLEDRDIDTSASLRPSGSLKPAPTSTFSDW
jgi:hypothetical protein